MYRDIRNGVYGPSSQGATLAVAGSLFLVMSCFSVSRSYKPAPAHGWSVTSLSVPGGYVLARCVSGRATPHPLCISVLVRPLSWFIGSFPPRHRSWLLQWPLSGLNKPQSLPPPVTSLRKRSETFQFIICLDATLSGMLTFSKLPTSAPFETCLVWRHQHIYIWSLIYLQWLGECLQQEAQESTEGLEAPCSHCGCRRFNAPHTLSLTSI